MVHTGPVSRSRHGHAMPGSPNHCYQTALFLGIHEKPPSSRRSTRSVTAHTGLEKCSRASSAAHRARATVIHVRTMMRQLATATGVAFLVVLALSIADRGRPSQRQLSSDLLEQEDETESVCCQSAPHQTEPQPQHLAGPSVQPALRAPVRVAKEAQEPTPSEWKEWSEKKKNDYIERNYGADALRRPPPSVLKLQRWN